MGIGSRKRGAVQAVRHESMVLPSAEESQREAMISRLFDGALRSARSQLLRADSPLAVEVWGSGLLAVWDSLGSGSPAQGGSFAEALVRHAAELGTAEGMAVLSALAGVAPSRVATRARTALTVLEQQGLSTPAWAEVVGTAVPTEAWVGSDVFGDQEIVILGFGYPTLAGDPGHSICVLIDHSARRVAKDAYPAAPLDQTLARWREAEADGVVLRPVSLAEVAARLADALVATDSAGVEGVGRTLVEMRALLAARLASLPEAPNTGFEELGSAGREWLVGEFLAAPEAAGLLSEPAAVVVCHSLVTYRCDYGDGDPLRWSPTLAGLCLLDHFPVRVSLDAPDFALVPDVLAAWVGFAARRKNLPESALTRILDVIDSCREDFPVAMTDVERYNPAKRCAMDLLRSGVDLTDSQKARGVTAGFAAG